MWTSGWVGSCQEHLAGEATKANRRDDPPWADLGYEVECRQYSTEEIGGNDEASHAYFAASERGCDAAAGTVIDDAGDPWPVATGFTPAPTSRDSGFSGMPLRCWSVPGLP